MRRIGWMRLIDCADPFPLAQNQDTALFTFADIFLLTVLFVRLSGFGVGHHGLLSLMIPHFTAEVAEITRRTRRLKAGSSLFGVNRFDSSG